MNEHSSSHGNRARQIIKAFDSLYKRMYADSIPALIDFSVDIIETEDYEMKFNPKDQIRVRDLSKSVIREVCRLSEEEILKRLDFKELPNYKMFSPYSGIFFVVNFTLRENLSQNYSPTKIKHVIEALYTKISFYDYVPIILTHKLDQTPGPVDFISGIKQTVFEKESFSQQKFEVTFAATKSCVGPRQVSSLDSRLHFHF